MPLHEPCSHTFLIRVWVEETVEEAGRLAWRGHITHLPDEKRHYIGSFGQINRFIQEQVEGKADHAGATRADDDDMEPGERGG